MNSKPLLAGLLTLICAAPIFGQSAAPLRLEGTWEGATLIRPAQVEVDFRLVIKSAGAEDFAGSISFPTQGAKEYALDTLIHDGSYVAFSTTDESSVVSAFQGQLSADGREVKGTVQVRGKEYGFAMTREEGEIASRSSGLQKASLQQDELKALFNQEAGKVRLLLILSPTSGTGRMGAILLQRYVLDEIEDPRLGVYVVWEPREPGDTEQEAQAAAKFLSDPRVSHFWAGKAFAGAAFKSVIGFQGDTPATDVYLLFPAEGRWTDAVPAPSSFMHYRPELPKERIMNAQILAGEVKALLAGPRPAAAQK